MAIKKAKYRVKNSEGEYDVVYLETSVDQVEGLDVEMGKKADQTAVEAEFQVVAGEIDAVETVAAGLGERLTTAEHDIAKEVEDRQAAITAVQVEVATVAGNLTSEVERATAAEIALDERVDALESSVGGNVSELITQVQANTSNIAAIDAAYKDADANLQNAIEGKVSQEDFSAEQTRVDEALALKAGKTQVAFDIATAKGEANDYTDAEIVKVNETITALDTAYKAADTALNNEILVAKNLANQAQADVGALELVVGDNKAAIEGTVSTLEGKVDGYIASNNTAVAGLQGEVDAVEGRLEVVEPKVTSLEGRVGLNETEIQNLKDAVQEKNSSTLVFNTMDEFNEAIITPKVGDLAFVLDIKKSFIFKGEEPATLELPAPPQGWVYFDEISTDVDLADYAKKAEVDTAIAGVEQLVADEYARALAAEGVLDGKIGANTGAINNEVSDRVAAVAGVQTNLTNLQNQVDNNVLTVGVEQPVNTLTGHVWLDEN